MDFTELMEAVNNAKTDSSPECVAGKEHSFKAVTHLDGRDSFTWVYRCEHCKEYVKRTQKRTGMNAEIWRG